MKSAACSSVLALSLLSLYAAPAAAQDPPFERIQLTTIVVKPGRMDEFEANLKLLNEARAKAKDPTTRTIWQVGRGGPARTFLVTMRINKWADVESLMTNSDVLAKAHGEREGLRINAALGDTIESGHSDVLEVWKGMNSWKDGNWGYAWISDTQVRPAAIPQWEQSVTARVAAMKKAPSAPPTVRYRTVLGTSARFVAARFFDKWSDLDGWPEMKDVAGQAETDRINGLARGAVESGSQYIIRRRSELSYVPAP